jgi:hypothetical protein
LRQVEALAITLVLPSWRHDVPGASGTRGAFAATIGHGRAILEYWRITRSASGHGSVNVSFSGDLLHGALWIAGPPLLIFVVWLATPTRTEERVQVPER